MFLSPSLTPSVLSPSLTPSVLSPTLNSNVLSPTLTPPQQWLVALVTSSIGPSVSCASAQQCREDRVAPAYHTIRLLVPCTARKLQVGQQLDSIPRSRRAWWLPRFSHTLYRQCFSPLKSQDGKQSTALSTRNGGCHYCHGGPYISESPDCCCASNMEACLVLQ